MARASKFRVGDHVVVVKGPFQEEAGVVHEICDDTAYVIVQFRHLKARMLCSWLAVKDKQEKKTSVTKKSLIASSHRKPTK